MALSQRLSFLLFFLLALTVLASEPEEDGKGFGDYLGLLFGTTCPTGGCKMGPIPADLAAYNRATKKWTVSWQKVMQHILRSWAVYRSSQQIVSGDFGLPYDVFPPNATLQFFSQGSLGFFLEKQADGTQWISVRGSVDLANWVSNFNIGLNVDTNFGMNAHSGFLELANDAYKLVRPFLDMRKPLKLTGHSMGGAVASILAYRLMVKDGFNVTEVVTFGAPKFIDASNTIYDTTVPLLRLVCESDPVAAMAPFEKFQHVGVEVRIAPAAKDDKWYWSKESTAYWSTWATQIPALFGFEPHYTKTYLNRAYKRHPVDLNLQAAILSISASTRDGEEDMRLLVPHTAEAIAAFDQHVAKNKELKLAYQQWLSS